MGFSFSQDEKPIVNAISKRKGIPFIFIYVRIEFKYQMYCFKLKILFFIIDAAQTSCRHELKQKCGVNIRTTLLVFDILFDHFQGCTTK